MFSFLLGVFRWKSVFLLCLSSFMLASFKDSLTATNIWLRFKLTLGGFSYVAFTVAFRALMVLFVLVASSFIFSFVLPELMRYPYFPLLYLIWGHAEYLYLDVFQLLYYYQFIFVTNFILLHYNTCYSSAILSGKQTWNCCQMWNLCSQVMTRSNLEKFHHDLNEKLIIVTNVINDSVWEVNLSKN